MNLTYRYNVVYDRNPDKVEKEEVLFSNINCTALKERFLKDNYKFGRLANTTFYVYVYDFEPPLWIIISFSQHPKLDLLQFFITFSSCFLALLLTAAILWKIKQRYDRYRRRQRLFVEMEQMASRPFGSVIVDLERMSSIASSSSSKAKRGEISSTVDGASGVLPQTSTNLTGDIACTTKAAAEVVVSTSTSIAGSLSEEAAKANLATASQQQSHSTVSQQQQSSSSSGGNRKRKRIKYRPSPIALEPCDGNRAAVLTLIVRLPTGGRTYAPAGYSGIAIASALVTLSNPRKSSGEGGTGSKNNDDPKRSKGRNKDRSQSSSRDNANNPGGGGGGNNPSSGNSGGVAIATTDM